MWRRGTVAPERQRKIDAITAALAARGYALDTWPGLVAGGGEWTVTATAMGEHVAPLRWVRLRAGTFDDLLAMVATGLGWATYVHGRLGEGGHQNRQDAERALYRATNAYGRACSDRLVANLDEATPLDADETVARAEGEVRRRHCQARELLRAMAEYDATVPTTEEGATAYLAGLPRRDVNTRD